MSSDKAETPRTPEDHAASLARDLNMGVAPVMQYAFRASMEQAWQEGYRACRRDDAQEKAFYADPANRDVDYSSVTYNPYRALTSPTQQPE